MGGAAASRMQWVVLLFLCLELGVVSAQDEEIELSVTSYLANHVFAGKGQNAVMQQSSWHTVEESVSSTGPTDPRPVDLSMKPVKQVHVNKIPIEVPKLSHTVIIETKVDQKDLVDWSPWFEYFSVYENLKGGSLGKVVAKFAIEISMELSVLVEEGEGRKRIVKPFKVFGNGMFHAAPRFAGNGEDNPDFRMLCWWPTLPNEMIGLTDDIYTAPPCGEYPPQDPAFWVETVIGENVIVQMEVLIPGEGGTLNVSWFSKGQQFEKGTWVKLMDVPPNKILMIPGSVSNLYMHYLLMQFKITIDDVHEVLVYHPLFPTPKDYAITYHITEKLIECSRFRWNHFFKHSTQTSDQGYTITTPVETLYTWVKKNKVRHPNQFAKPPAIVNGPLARIHRAPSISPRLNRKALKGKRFRSPMKIVWPDLKNLLNK